MFKTIENLTHRVVILHFNSGQTLYIGPRSTSGEIPDVELRNNGRIKKLRERGVIFLHPVEKRRLPKRPVKDKGPAAGKEKPGPTKKNKKSKTQIKSKGGE